MNLQIYRNQLEVAVITIGDDTVFTHKIMGEHKIDAYFISNAPLAINIGDYIIVGSEKFYINSVPTIDKINNFTYSYNIVFEGEIYSLYNKTMMDEGSADFSYHGDAEFHLQLLIDNMNSISSGWAIGDFEVTEGQTLSYVNQSCRSALSTIAEAFTLEYRLVGKTIHLVKSIGVATTLEFQYGRGAGLYKLTRNTVSDKNVITRVYGFGAAKNLNYDYRDGKDRLVFEALKLESNVDLYGIREGSYTNDDIYPSRTGTVTAIDSETKNAITDSSLDFDINTHLLEGVVAKIVFKTGALSGYEFEISSYSNTLKEITFIPFTEDNGYVLPNDLNFPEVGDTYTLVDIEMPQTYIDAAEAKLLAATELYLAENDHPRVTYQLEIDEKYVRDNGIDLQVGHTIKVIDTPLGIDNDIRVSEISYPLINPALITAVIADTIPYTIQEQLISTIVDNRIVTRNVDRNSVELSRRNSLKYRALQSLIFDPDGYFDADNIKPQSIETLMLSVGAKSQNFGLIEVIFEPNKNADANSLAISGGKLAHYEIEIDGLGYVWNLDAASFNTLIPEKPYYVYAKCSKTALTGIWQISDTPKKTEEETGYYLFNVGILYAVVDGRRDFDFTKGMTFINGATITTGRIQSMDALNYFDLDGNQLKVGNSTSGMDWNVSQPDKLTIKGGLVQSPSGATSPISVYRGAYDALETYFYGDEVTYNGSTYISISQNQISGFAPTLTEYWTATAQKGNYIKQVYRRYSTNFLLAGFIAAGFIKHISKPEGVDPDNWFEEPPQGTDPLYMSRAIINSYDQIDGEWSEPVRITGKNGVTGAGVVYRGVFVPDTMYYNNTKRRDIVKYNNTYYVYKGVDAISISSFTIEDWEDFGAQFSSVATDILFAEMAYIENLGVRHLKTGDTGERIEATGATMMYYDDTGALKFRFESNLYEGLGGLSMTAAAIKADSNSHISIDGDGTIYNKGFSAWKLGMQCGVGQVNQLVLGYRSIATGGTVSLDPYSESFNYCTNNNSLQINLPSAYEGTVIYVKRSGSGDVNVASTSTINGVSSSYPVQFGNLVMFVYTKVGSIYNWVSGRMLE